MPETEQCILGAENKIRIDNMEKLLDEIKCDIRKLTNHYALRPQWWVAILLTFLCTVSGSLIVYLVTH